MPGHAPFRRARHALILVMMMICRSCRGDHQRELVYLIRRAAQQCRAGFQAEAAAHDYCITFLNTSIARQFQLHGLEIGAKISSPRGRQFPPAICAAKFDFRRRCWTFSSPDAFRRRWAAFRSAEGCIGAAAIDYWAPKKCRRGYAITAHPGMRAGAGAILAKFSPHYACGDIMY